MPISAAWDNDDQTVVRIEVHDPWTVEEYLESAQHACTLIDTVDHMVHLILDFTHVYSFPSNLLFSARTTNTPTHPRQGLVIAVKISPYLRDHESGHPRVSTTWTEFLLCSDRAGRLRPDSETGRETSLKQRTTGHKFHLSHSP